MATDWDWPDSTILRIIDGDSFVAQMVRDLGFNGWATFTQHLRLDRINCPPASTDAGKAATLAVSTLMPPGVAVQIVTTGPYKYGDEWMAEVTTAAGLNISDELVKQGVALYWNGKGPRPGG